MFIGMCRRSGKKPACISLHITRAIARATLSAGQRPTRGNFSARYSRIASDSQTHTSPSISTGTLPVPDTEPTTCLKLGSSSEITVSSNGILTTFIAIPGRIDHEEYFLLPMINFSVMAALLYSCSQIAGASLRRQANCSNGFEKCREWWSLRLRRGCFDGPARLSPGTKSALDMRDWFEAHALRSLRGKSRTQTTGAKKNKLLVLGKYRFVVRALGIDPKLQHPSRTMKGAWH